MSSYVFKNILMSAFLLSYFLYVASWESVLALFTAAPGEHQCANVCGGRCAAHLAADNLRPRRRPSAASSETICGTLGDNLRHPRR
jgi:hypothetical protein